MPAAEEARRDRMRREKLSKHCTLRELEVRIPRSEDPEELKEIGQKLEDMWLWMETNSRTHTLERDQAHEAFDLAMTARAKRRDLLRQ